MHADAKKIEFWKIFLAEQASRGYNKHIVCDVCGDRTALFRVWAAPGTCRAPTLKEWGGRNMSDEKRAALSGEPLLGELSRLILNDTNQMIQLADLDTLTMLYANRPALEYAVHSGEPYEGRHCYENT